MDNIEAKPEASAPEEAKTPAALVEDSKGPAGWFKKHLPSLDFLPKFGPIPESERKDIIKAETKDLSATLKELIPPPPKLTTRELRNGADIAFGGIDFDQNGQLSQQELMRSLKYPFEGSTPEMKVGVSLMNKHFEAFRMMENKPGITLPSIHKIDQLGSLTQLPAESPLYFYAKKDAYIGGSLGAVVGAGPSYMVGKFAYNLTAAARPGLAPLVGLAAGLVTEAAITGIGAAIGYNKGREADNIAYENGQKAKLKALYYDLQVPPGVIKD